MAPYVGHLLECACPRQEAPGHLSCFCYKNHPYGPILELQKSLNCWNAEKRQWRARYAMHTMHWSSSPSRLKWVLNRRARTTIYAFRCFVIFFPLIASTDRGSGREPNRCQPLDKNTSQPVETRWPVHLTNQPYPERWLEVWLRVLGPAVKSNAQNHSTKGEESAHWLFRQDQEPLSEVPNFFHSKYITLVKDSLPLCTPVLPYYH